MKKRKVYVVMGSEGSYDEYREFVEKVFSSRKKAEKYAGYDPKAEDSPGNQFAKESIEEWEVE